MAAFNGLSISEDSDSIPFNAFSKSRVEVAIEYRTFLAAYLYKHSTRLNIPLLT